MKKYLIALSILGGCIQTDLEDPFPPTLRIASEVLETNYRVNGVYPLHAVFTDESGEPVDTAIEWISSDEKTLQIENNNALPLKEGFVSLTARVNGLTDRRTLEILSSREMITITQSVATLQVGKTFNLSAIYIDPDGRTIEATPIWSSSDTTVASVDEEGLVSANAEGMVEISIQFGNVMDQISLNIIEEEIRVDPTLTISSFAMFMKVGESFQFEALYIDDRGEINESASIQWSSSNEAVLSIGTNGLGMALSGGVCSISASFDTLSATIEVAVEDNDTAIRTGTLMGTGYDITGSFALESNSQGDLVLTINNYSPDGPGPYFYLSNQSSTVANAINLGEAGTAGNYTINVTEIDITVGINSYDYLVVWCQPFGVTLGFGELSN